MSEQTDDVLADIDAALEGWHGRDASISPDAMRWAPEPPAGEPRQPSSEEIQQAIQAMRQAAEAAAAAMQQYVDQFTRGLRAVRFTGLLNQPGVRVAPAKPVRGLRADRVILDETPPPDPRRQAALEAVRSRSTGPAGPRLDGRRSR